MINMLNKRGLTITFTTVILIGVMTVAVGVAIFYSNSLIEFHSELTEFENAKNLLIYSADALEQVALGSGGSKYVRFNLRTARLNLLRNFYENISVFVNGIRVISDIPDAIEIIGGSLVSVGGFKLISPPINNPNEINEEYNKIIVSAGDPLVIVYENQSNGARVVLLCKRVRVNYLGVYSLLKGGETYNYSTFELSYIMLIVNKTGGTGNLPIVFRNVNVTTNTYIFDSSSITINVMVNGNIVETRTLTGESDVDGSLVVVRVSYVYVNTIG